MIEESLYIDLNEKNFLENMLDESLFCDEFIDYYRNFEEKIRKPDLYGKTVKITNDQFSSIYDMVYDICEKQSMKVPDIYVYEDFYYGAESRGIDNPWIEISSKTIEDFTEKELKFILAREICSINLKHTYYKTFVDESIKFMNEVNFIGMDTFTNITKSKVYKWYRVTNYTCDNFGYIACKDLESCISAIMKTILNSCFLVENLNIKEYMNQSIEINKLDDKIYNYTKADEKVPYGPFRIKNLISYATSARGIKSMKEEL